MAHVKWIDTSDLKGVTPPEVDWVIKDVAAVGALSLMVGAPGMGKSFLSLALAKTGNHRALGDIQDSIAELAYYRTALFVSPANNSTPEEVSG